MSAVLERVKNIFRRNPRPQKLPPGSFPPDSGNGETFGTIRKPGYPTDDDDDDEDFGIENYNVPEQTRLRDQRRDTLQSDAIPESRNSFVGSSTLPPTSSNPPNASFRGVSSGFVPGLPMNNNPNNNMNSSSNINTGTTPNLPSRAGLPFLSQIQDSSSRSPINLTSASTNNPQPSFGGVPPGVNPNQPRTPTPANPQPSFGGVPPGVNPNQPRTPTPANPQPSFGGSSSGTNLNQTPTPPTNVQSPSSRVSPGMNTNQASLPSTTNNPQSSVPGFLPGMNPQSLPSTSNLPPSDSNNLVNPQQGPFTKSVSSFRNESNNNDDNVSRLELDYPIENVLIDANIPPTVAIKINEVVEKDRFGNAYHIHRYTFEPSTPQQISFGNNQHMIHRFVENPHHGGARHIREIHDNHQNSLFDDMIYPQRSNKQDRQHHHHYSETSLDQYIEELLHTPGSIFIQAQDFNDLQRILNQQLPNNQLIPIQSSINPFQTNTNTFAEPVFYYTAQALPNDPMRIY